VAAATALWLLAASDAFAGTRQTAPKRVVALYWYGKDFSSNVVFERGLRAGFQTVPKSSLEYYPEFLESNRFPGEEQARVFRDYLRRKYADQKIDAVIALSDTALNFLLSYRDELFPNAPIVYHTFNRPEFNGRGAGAGLTGVVADGVFKNTLDVALRLHPGTREVLVIIGTPERDRKLERSVRRELQNFEKRTTLKYLSDLQLAPVLTQVKQAKAGSLVFYVRQSQDEPGNTLDPSDVLSLVTSASSVPVYSLATGALMGRGTVGGYGFDLEACGTRVAETALRIMNGARPEDIPVVQQVTSARFDWRQLQRWGIREDRLPMDAVVLFREPSTWERYWSLVLGVLAVLIAQSALIGGLLLQRSRRRSTEKALTRSETALRDSYERSMSLAGRLITAQEEERKRIARDLHDDMGQRLAVLSIGLEQLARVTAPSGIGSARDLARLAKEMVHDVHQLSHELHPAKLDILGLVGGVQCFCRDVSRQHGLNVDFRHALGGRSPSPDIAVGLFRIVQEALHNVVKHAGSRDASVRLSERRDTLHLHVADRGRGFDMRAHDGEGLGLLSMRERVRVLGGTIVVRSAPGRGTRIAVHVSMRPRTIRPRLASVVPRQRQAHADARTLARS
jgi:signal transduction histidine kinase